MPAITIPRLTAIGAVVAAAALVQLARTPRDGSSAVPAATAPLPTREEPSPRRVTATAATPSETPASAKQREIEAMSETFRNTTFLIAIRDSGFVCNELLRAVGGLDGSTKWVATCSGMLAYTVGVAGNGTLRVEPMMQYFDGTSPVLIEPDGELVVPRQPIPQPR